MWFNIDLIILFLFLVANFIVGFGIRRKVSNKVDVNNFKTYSIGNFEKPSLFFLTASFTSSIITGGFFLILLQQSYKTGMSYIIKNILIDPLSYVITAFFVYSMHKNTKRGGLSLNEWMDEKYHSSFLRAVMGLSELVGRFAMLAIQFKAFGTFAKVLFNMPPQYEKMCIIGVAIFLMLYTCRGGFTSIVLTDILQFWVFIVAFVSLVIFVIFKSDFFAGVWDKGVVENPKMSLAPCFKNFDAAIFTLGIWVKTLFPKLNGPRYQRIMMSTDSKKVKNSLFCTAGIVAFFTTSCVCMALLVYSKNPDLKIPEIVPFFINNYCPIGLRGLLGAGLFAMSISTAESILNCNSVVFTNDVMPLFYKMFSKKTYTPSVFMARLATILVGCIGLTIALKSGDMFSLLMGFGNFYHPIATVPSLVLVLGFNVKKASIMSGVFCGVIATIIYYAYTGNISSFFLGLIANFAGLILMELFLRLKQKGGKTSEIEQA